MELGDGFKKMKNIEEVKLRWKKMKKRRGDLTGRGRHGGSSELGSWPAVVWPVGRGWL